MYRICIGQLVSNMNGDGVFMISCLWGDRHIIKELMLCAVNVAQS